MTNPQSCATCQHQRKKCTVDCPLAPYFPSSYPTNFHNAHKLFGVSRVVDSTNSSPPSLPTSEAPPCPPSLSSRPPRQRPCWRLPRRRPVAMAIAQTLEDFKDNVGMWNVYDHIQFHQVQKKGSQEQEEQGNIGAGVPPQPQEEQANVF
ncbi:hypothetical protein ACFX2I_042907 [Malus domestica]|uniref:LOB domain-containing protein 22-like n=1 Tax=Malus domestica TaxID=3750 RepID=UPI0039756AD8